MMVDAEYSGGVGAEGKGRGADRWVECMRWNWIVHTGVCLRVDI